MGIQKRVQEVAVCDLGEDVYFYLTRNSQLYHADGKNVLARIEGPDWLAKAIAKRSKGKNSIVRAVTTSWARHHFLIYLESPSKFLAFGFQ